MVNLNTAVIYRGIFTVETVKTAVNYCDNFITLTLYITKEKVFLMFQQLFTFCEARSTVFLFIFIEWKFWKRTVMDKFKPSVQLYMWACLCLQCNYNPNKHNLMLCEATQSEIEVLSLKCVYWIIPLVYRIILFMWNGPGNSHRWGSGCQGDGVWT